MLTATVLQGICPGHVCLQLVGEQSWESLECCPEGTWQLLARCRPRVDDCEGTGSGPGSLPGLSEGNTAFTSPQGCGNGPGQRLRAGQGRAGKREACPHPG